MRDYAKKEGEEKRLKEKLLLVSPPSSLRVLIPPCTGEANVPPHANPTFNKEKRKKRKSSSPLIRGKREKDEFHFRAANSGRIKKLASAAEHH